MFKAIKRSSKSKVSNLSRHLRNQILNGELPAGVILPTTDELARSNGVSAITVNRIMAMLAEEGLVNRIKGKGTFVKDHNVVPQTQLKIGIADNIDPSEGADLQKIMGLLPHYCANLLTAHNADVKIIPYQELTSLEKASKQLNGLDGLLFSNGYMDQVTYANISHFDIPVVMYKNEYIVDCKFNQVVTDLSGNMTEIFRNITPSDYDEIVVVSEQHTNGRLRRDAFINAAIAAGYDYNKIVKIETMHYSQADGGYRIGRQLAEKSKNRFVFSTSDFVSFGIIDALHDCGVEPGRDIQLLSFDNLEGYGIFHYPKPLLTSIDTSRQIISRKIVELLLAKISNPDNCQHIIKVPTQLVIRNTALSDKPS